MKKIALFVVTAALLMFGASSATAYPPAPPTVVVSTTVTGPGGTVEVMISGCEPGETIQINAGGTSSTATADASGSATVSTTAPDNFGMYAIGVTCGGATTTVEVEVIGIPATNGGGGSFDLSDATPDAGESFVLSINDFCGGGNPQSVTVVFAGARSSKTTDVNGQASFVLVAPSAPGRYSGSVTCADGFSAPFFVVVGDGARGFASVDDEIPSVGAAGTTTWLTAGIVTTAVGAGLFAVARFRRREDNKVLAQVRTP